jgi:hypothetical protein
VVNKYKYTNLIVAAALPGLNTCPAKSPLLYLLGGGTKAAVSSKALSKIRSYPLFVQTRGYVTDNNNKSKEIGKTTSRGSDNTIINTNPTPSQNHESLLKGRGGTFTLFKLNFKFENNLISLLQPSTINDKKSLSPSEFLQTINTFLEDFNLVNEKGYVKTTDDPNSIFTSINKFFKDIKYQGSIATSDRTFHLWVNLIIVNLYFLCLYKDKELQKEAASHSHIEDMRADLKNLILKLYSRLDPSIRLKIQKRGVTVIQNIYTGYDSEYVLKDARKHLNKLLSVQLALNTRTIIKIPLYEPYEISYIHPLTSSIYKFYQIQSLNNSVPTLENGTATAVSDIDEDSHSCDCTGSILTEKDQNSNSKSQQIERIELEILQKSIRNTIDLIRELKYSNHDNFLLELIDTLKQSKGITYFEDEEKDQIVFALPRTPILKKVLYPDENPQFVYSFENLVKTSNLLANSSLIESYSNFILELKSAMPSLQSQAEKEKENSFGGDLRSINSSLSSPLGTTKVESEIIKSRQRTTYKIGSYLGESDPTEKLSVSRVKNNYFCSHLTNADLSILTDFTTLKENLDIIQKSFVTLGKPLQIDNSSVYIRDTMLLAPAGNRSLESLGKLYSCKKLDISLEEKENMDMLLKGDRKRFEEYAQQDAVITLKHALAMEDFNIQLKHIGVPITLSSLGRKYVLDKWSNLEYQKMFKSGGYQPSKAILIGQSESVQTPKGLKEMGNIGIYLSYYIANYKGGRNESFMYGVDTNTVWYDYDLISAYTTAMADLGLPSYSESTLLLKKEIEEWSLEKYLNSYILIKGYFNFPNNTKYPSIPCYIDGTCTATVYPLSGQCFLTGPEYYLAKLQGCEIQIDSIIYTPYKTVTERIGAVSTTSILKPFYSIIKELQSMRKEYPKGDIMNLLYKEMGNSIYGNVVRGIADKRKFDIKTGRNQRINSTELSNPILASKTTGFIRSVIGECLHNISRIGGKVVSVTTDGFITDVIDLENKLLNLKSTDIPLFTRYREIRENLSGCSTALEIKHFGKGIISWTTRGQLGIESKIKATTGFQSFGYTQEELITNFKKVLSSKEKYFEFTQSSLRGANEIYKKGGHVTPTYKDRIFRLMYDNRRLIIDEDAKGKGNFFSLDFRNSFDVSSVLLDSRPLNSVEECARIRFISKIQISNLYNRNTSKRSGNVYKQYLEIAVKNFIKGYLNKEPLFGLKGNEFKNYIELLEFIKGYEPAKHIKLTSQSISNLKHRKMIFKPVVKRKETLDFIEYVKTKIKVFNENDFFK